MGAPNEAELLATGARVVAGDAAAIAAAARAIDDRFAAACRCILACSGKTLVTGSGTSGLVAARAAHLLSVCGTPAFYLSPGDGLHGGLGVLQANDGILAISKGGSSGELNEFCRRARRLTAFLIAITAAPQSEFAKLADHVLVLDLPADADLGSVVATGSSLAAAALTDALAETLRVARGYGWDQLLFTHPSGAVGRDAARTLDRLGRG